jgi:hypothetical protein
MMKRNWASRIALFLLLAAVFFCAAGIANACPTCKDAVAANDPEHAGIVKGYFYSILFMMGMPYALITCFGLYMWRQVKLARARDPAKSESLPEGNQPHVSSSAVTEVKTAGELIEA